MKKVYAAKVIDGDVGAAVRKVVDQLEDLSRQISPGDRLLLHAVRGRRSFPFTNTCYCFGCK